MAKAPGSSRPDDQNRDPLDRPDRHLGSRPGRPHRLGNRPGRRLGRRRVRLVPVGHRLPGDIRRPAPDRHRLADPADRHRPPGRVARPGSAPARRSVDPLASASCR